RHEGGELRTVYLQIVRKHAHAVRDVAQLDVPLHHRDHLQGRASAHGRRDNPLLVEMAEEAEVLRELVWRGEVLLPPVEEHRVVEDPVGVEPDEARAEVAHVEVPVEEGDLPPRVHGREAGADERARGVEGHVRRGVVVDADRVEDDVHPPAETREPLRRLDRQALDAEGGEVGVVTLGRRGVHDGPLVERELDRREAEGAVPPDDQHVRAGERRVRLPRQVEGLPDGRVDRREAEGHGRVGPLGDADEVLVRYRRVLGVSSRGDDGVDVVSGLEGGVRGGVFAEREDGTNNVRAGDVGQALLLMPLAPADHAVLKRDVGALDLDDHVRGRLWGWDVAHLLEVSRKYTS
ncbi:hypothetical protein THAOC_20015, partial [Thalassiosira oceanica]